MAKITDEHLRGLLTGCATITPQELWLMLHGPDVPCEGARLAGCEEALERLGYRKVPVHPVRASRDGFEWVREDWLEDDRFEDLREDPLLALLWERYIQFQVANGAGQVH